MTFADHFISCWRKLEDDKGVAANFIECCDPVVKRSSPTEQSLSFSYTLNGKKMTFRSALCGPWSEPEMAEAAAFRIFHERQRL